MGLSPRCADSLKLRRECAALSIVESRVSD